MNKDNQEKFADLTAKWLISQLLSYISSDSPIDIDMEGLRSDIKYKMERLFESLDDSYEKTQCPSKEQLIKAFKLLKTRGCFAWDKDKNADEVIKHWDDDNVKE